MIDLLSDVERPNFHSYLLMMDSHYYMTALFDDGNDILPIKELIWRTVNSGIWSTVGNEFVYVTGGNFCPYPGKYLLPNSEGTYTVTYDESSRLF